ncbi:MAG TPA: ShlB/FhaC/HecB family hemolysin secretion/activation protein [Amphiplicatus sp.]|nr:ShlB/FhaC/HecB family hemolysin secretion/activation protein [Amphiplicatus sp.]
MQKHRMFSAAASGAVMALAIFDPGRAQTSPTEFEQRMDPAVSGEVETPPKPENELPSASAEVEAGKIPATPITSIRFEGTDVPAIVADAARPFVGRTASAEVLKELAAAMSAAYGKSSVALFTLVIPEQNFVGGVVRVRVAEGFIEKVILSGEVEGREHELVKAYAKRITEERPTSRAVLERYLSLINDIPGLKAEPKLKLGRQPGAVRLHLKLDYQRPTVSFGFNNRTTGLFEHGQFSAEGKAYRLLRDGDETRLNLAASVDFDDYLYAGLQHSTPIGGDGVRLDISAAALTSRPNNTPVEGDAQIYAIGVSYPLLRSYRRNIMLRASFDALNSDNAAFGSLIATERTRAGRLSARYTQTSKTQSLSVTSGLSRGFDALDAEVTAPYGEAEYFKASTSASLSQKVSEGFFMRLNAAGQWTNDRLPANERFSLGGDNFGRGFNTSVVNADRGFALLAEPAFRPIRQGVFAHSEVYAFADYAQADILSRGLMAQQTVDLGSYGFGVRAAFKKKAVIDFGVAKSYDKPYPTTDDDWLFSIKWRVNTKA